MGETALKLEEPKEKLLGRVIPLFKEGPGHSGTLIHMRNVPGRALYRALDAPLSCLNFDGSLGQVPADFEWDGSSVPRLLQGLFPRHNHPIASCRHDWRCKQAKNRKERAWADAQFKEDVGTTSWWITKQAAYLGVRVGAFLGAGVEYDHWTDIF